MNKFLFLLFCWLPLLMFCDQIVECNGIKNDQYSGHAIVFFHMPVSGSSYEIIIVPVCGDTSELISRIDSSLDKIKLLGGVDCTIGSRGDSLFSKVFNKSQKIKLAKNQDFAAELKTIYVCPVYIEFKNAENTTRYATRSKQDSLHEKLIFVNGKQVILSYFLSDELEITSLRVL